MTEQQMPTAADAGRTAYADRRWSDAFRAFGAAGDLVADDLERLAVAAHLTGHDPESESAWAAAASRWWAAGEAHRGVSCVFWLAIDLLLRGRHAHSAGWIVKARRALAESSRDGAGEGYVRAHAGLVQFIAGDTQGAAESFAAGLQVGRQYDDAELAVFAGVGLGEALVRAGSVADGMATLDEAIVTVSTGDLSPINTGLAYCAGLITCQEVLDLARAREWTIALNDWCSDQPDLVPYRGQCLVHRSQVTQLDGDWRAALADALLAEERLAGHPAEGEAYYQEGELLRLVGDRTAAGRAYQRASDLGRDPQPGLALLRLQEGRRRVAIVMLRRALDETSADCRRARLLGALVEGLLGVPDTEDEIDRHVRELAAIAGRHSTVALTAMADHARGASLLADHGPAAALAVLRRAAGAWREVGAPYEVARVRELLAAACAELGDVEAAGLEREAAAGAFRTLGALPDLARISDTPLASGTLTEREVEVLRLVAAGHSNREISARLTLSEHTVRRHVQNIFGKTGVTSRAAATAYAFRHGLA